MQKKWWLVGGAVVLAAALLVGGQLLLTHRIQPTPSPAENPAAPATGAASDTASGGHQSKALSRAPLSVTTSPSASATRTIPRPPAAAFIRLPATKPYAAAGPRAPGDPLGRLTTPPTRLIAGYRRGVMMAGSAYAVTIRPWGYAASDSKGPTLVVTVDKIRALGLAPPRTSLVNADLLIVMTPGRGGVITNGGTYSAVVTFLADGDRLVPMLSGAKSLSR